jgi:CheY-like chemotaxis protein
MAVETSRPIIDDFAHKLTVSLPPEPIHLDADLTRLAQVFSNLLNNASRYMEPHGHIWLTAERQGNEVVVSVRDIGIGIAAEQLPRIFEIFSQVDRSLERSQGGLGIGLTLVKQLVEMHDGTVEAKSDGLGRGAEFRVRLPVESVASSTGDSGKPEEPAALESALRILIVDDNRDSAESLAMMLHMLGHEIRVAHDGKQGADAAEDFRPAVVLLDIGLPSMNGYEVCRHIRSQPWGSEMIVVALTGWGQEEDRRKSSEAGFDHHIVKPINPRELMTILAEQ